MIAKTKIAWAINETQSMRSASKLLRISYNTFKKYAKMYELFQPVSNRNIPRNSLGKPIELEHVLAGKHPNYSSMKLFSQLVKESYLAEECSNCDFDEYRTSDMTKPLMLDYLDDDQTNKELANLRVLCYNCYYILKMDRLNVDVPSNVKSFQKAIYNAFSSKS